MVRTMTANEIRSAGIAALVKSLGPMEWSGFFSSLIRETETILGRDPNG